MKTYMTQKLKFSDENAKLVNGQAIFSLPAGHSCPFAQDCLAFADRETGKVTDGPGTQFRCFAASGEAWAKNAREARWHNFDLLRAAKTREAMASLIMASLPEASLYRIHASGDFYSQAYFDAWMDVARAFPDRVFYAYTKAVKFWVNRLGSIPENMRLVASYGGTHDKLIVEHKLKSAVVVDWPAQAEAMGLEIDHDDSHAWQGQSSFALLVHGTQKAGSEAAKAWSAQRAERKAEKAAKALAA